MTKKPSAGHNAAIGKMGENLACNLLTNLGYSIIDRNVKVHHKELDIVAIDSNSLVVVEVKTRSYNTLFDGSWGLNNRKISNVTSAGYEYARTHYSDIPVRFDSVICQQNFDGTFSLRHEKDAFYAPLNKVV